MRAGPGRAVRCSAVLAAAVLLAACIGGDDDPGRDDRERTEADSDTLRLGIGGPLVVDPAAASLASSTELMVLDLLYDGLTRLGPDGTAQPALASSWEANDQLTAFRFHLDPEATFSGGRAVTPEDVIASLERVMSAGDSSLPALSLEAVEGFRAFAEGDAEHVSGLTAPTPTTVRIALTTPLSVLPTVLSSPILAVIDPDTVEGDLGELDLSGGWAVASSDDGDLVLDSRTEEGSVRTIELDAHDDEDAAYDAFEDGDVDWAQVPPSSYDQAVEDYGDDAFAPFQAELFFGMNVDARALRSAPMRQAIMLAIDRDAIVEAVYPDLADPLTTVVPAGVAGHDPDRCPTCTPDPQRAADIVAFAYPNGDVPTVNIDYDESPPQEAMAELVAADLEDAGIPTHLRAYPLDEYEAFVVSGDQVLFSFGWIGAYVSPDAYLAPLFGSSANDNLTGYRSDQVDGLLERARASTNPILNADRWADAEQTVLEAAVVVPIAQFRTQVVVADRVEGFETAVDGTVDWAQVTLTS